MSENLLPCPFCGGKAKVRNASLGAYVLCTKCLCSTAGETNPAKAITAWNKRAELFGNLDCYECMNGYPMVRLRTCTNVSDAGFGFKCSECGDWEDIEHNPYCPHCGAKVVEEVYRGR